MFSSKTFNSLGKQPLLLRIGSVYNAEILPILHVMMNLV